MLTVLTIREDGIDRRESYADAEKLLARVTELTGTGHWLIPGFDIQLVETDDAAFQAYWDELCEKTEAEAEEEFDELAYAEHLYCSADDGDYGPGNPWDAPGMCVSDFIRGCSPL